MLGLAKSGQNHQRFIDIAAATARMKNIHTTMEDSVYYPHLSDLNKTECVVHRQVPIDDACMLGGALIICQKSFSSPQEYLAKVLL